MTMLPPAARWLAIRTMTRPSSLQAAATAAAPHIFGWMKTVGGLRKTRNCGRTLVEWFFVLTATAYNLIAGRARVDCRAAAIPAIALAPLSESRSKKHSHPEDFGRRGMSPSGVS